MTNVKAAGLVYKQTQYFVVLLIFYAAVTHVAHTRFEADEGIMDVLVGFRTKKQGRRGERTQLLLALVE